MTTWAKPGALCCPRPELVRAAAYAPGENTHYQRGGHSVNHYLKPNDICLVVKVFMLHGDPWQITVLTANHNVVTVHTLDMAKL